MSIKKIQIGDNVSMINETTSGVVVEINADVIVILSEDGFTFKCEANDVVLKGNLHDYLNNDAHDELLKENQPERKRSLPKMYSKKNKIPPMEVDLHINQLVKNTKGLSNYDILDLQINTAKRKLEFAINKKIQKVVFIHGVGEGVLKTELSFLFKKYSVQACDASYQKYGLGATEVHINQNSSVV